MFYPCGMDVSSGFINSPKKGGIVSMISLLNLKWIKQCQFQLRELAGDPEKAHEIVKLLDEDPDLRRELAHIYVLAKETKEKEELSGVKKP
jgi:hypothetical protein